MLPWNTFPSLGKFIGKINKANMAVGVVRNILRKPKSNNENSKIKLCRSLAGATLHCGAELEFIIQGKSGNSVN